MRNSNDEVSVLAVPATNPSHRSSEPAAVFNDPLPVLTRGNTLPGMLGRGIQTAPLADREICSSRVFGTLDPKQPKAKKVILTFLAKIFLYLTFS